MNSDPRIHARAFTLVELLTVIAIIAILMGLLFPAISLVKEHARRSQAKHELTQIVAAVKQYFADYGTYPTLVDPPVGDTTFDAATGNKELFNVLRSLPSGANTDYKYNPKRTTYFEGKSVSDPNAPRGGFDANGTFYDPWGNLYAIVMDSDYDNLLTVPHTDFTTTKPHAGAGAYSLGKDNQLGNAVNDDYKDSDDVISWQ